MGWNLGLFWDEIRDRSKYHSKTIFIHPKVNFTILLSWKKCVFYGPEFQPKFRPKSTFLPNWNNGWKADVPRGQKKLSQTSWNAFGVTFGTIPKKSQILSQKSSQNCFGTIFGILDVMGLKVPRYFIWSTFEVISMFPIFSDFGKNRHGY